VQEIEKLPARLAWLTGLAAIVIASATSAATVPTKALSAATAAGTWPVGLGLGFVDGQGASTEFSSVQSGDGFLGFAGVGHFHKAEATGAASFAVGHDTDFFHFSVSLENGAQLCLGCIVG
jgi:hypothetical protein